MGNGPKMDSAKESHRKRMTRKTDYTNKSLKKALSVLELFSEQVEMLSMKEIAEKLGTRPGTIFPILSTLKECGYLEKDKGNKKYSLGLTFLGKGTLVLRRLDIRGCAQPHLKELLIRCNENVHLAILDNRKVMYIDRKEAAPSLMIRSYVGKRVPAHCTALGKALLAFLDDQKLEDFLKKEKLERLTDNTITNPEDLKDELEKVRSAGFAIDNEEFQKGGICIAAPIKSYQDKVVAAISMSVPKSRFSDERAKKIIREVKNASLNISRSLGYKSKKSNEIQAPIT